MANIHGGVAAWVACDKCDNPEGFPPFLALEGVLATDTGELGIAASADMVGEIVDGATRLMTE